MNKGQIAVNECSLYCIADKTGFKKDIILLHGAKFSAATREKIGILDVLSEAGYRIRALDMPEFEKSAPCQIPTFHLLHDFIIQEHIESPVLIDPSMGGSICLDYYFSYPETLRGLVLIGAVGIQKNRDRFRDVNVPCFLVWGEKDTSSPLSNTRFLQQEISAAAPVVIEKASHPCYLDQPDLWHQSLVRYLKKNTF